MTALQIADTAAHDGKAGLCDWNIFHRNVAGRNRHLDNVLLTRHGKTCQRRSGVDDDLGERGPGVPLPAPSDPEADEQMMLAIPRTITAELEGPEIPPAGAPPTAAGNGDGAGVPPPTGGGDPPDDHPTDTEDDKAGDARRARSEVEKHLRTLQQIAVRICATSADADELVQNTALHVFKHGIAITVKCPDKWLVTMMKNLFIDQCRAAKRRPPHEPLEDRHAESIHDNVTYFRGDDPEPAWEHITIEDVWTALQQITEKFREVYILHTFEHWTYERIATHLKISTVTVGTRLTRARARLRQILKR